MRGIEIVDRAKREREIKSKVRRRTPTEDGTILKKKLEAKGSRQEKARFKGKESEAPNYRRNALTRVRVPRRYTHDLGRV